MADIIVEARNFSGPFSKLNGSFRIPVSLRTYVRASITVGFQNEAQFRSAPKRLRIDRFLNGHRAHNMLIRRADDLCLAPEFEHLDMSEKVGLSFWHGTILAKLVAEQHLGIPWLANVDELRRQGRLTISAITNERGDFVGRDQDLVWHAIEAKARSSTIDATLIEEAKKQASRITTIEGQPPRTCCASVADLSTTPITVYLEDPPAGGSRIKQLRLGSEDFWQYYYGNLAGYIEQGRQNVRVDGLPDYIFAPIYLLVERASPEPIELFLGLPESLARNPMAAAELASQGALKRTPYVGLDYVALAGRLPDWLPTERD